MEGCCELLTFLLSAVEVVAVVVVAAVVAAVVAVVEVAPNFTFLTVPPPRSCVFRFLVVAVTVVAAAVETAVVTAAETAVVTAVETVVGCWSGTVGNLGFSGCFSIGCVVAGCSEAPVGCEFVQDIALIS